ncbi:LysE/ArgO family amino acid transporter [Mangrovicoccus sp. HB161399]|uniref:LysE/ArgO family amino acid transporter n=1 Tax=Mangrovicoccus sp. HB161399 TaxID=2720392 RepID=UPI001557841F|nr:LysE/ArgO family amino acid transporter [Mangrovicoccus sp. HB161399]
MFQSVYFAGLSMGLSLIVAIGAQNAFVLRQGLRGEHVFAICLACALSDAVLVSLGVAGFARIVAVLPAVEPAMRYGGAAFLVIYGARSFVSAFGPGAVLAASGGGGTVPLSATLATCMAFTWLNPHVYLDTVMLLGSISTQFPGQERAFALGAITAAFGFFFALGYGAACLRPVFASATAWRVLDAGIAVVMWAIALKLLHGG